MDKRQLADTAVYEIRVKGVLGSRWAHWFEGMTVDANDACCETTLRGIVVDQAALHGLLTRISNLSLPLLSLHRIEIDRGDESLNLLT